MVIERELHLVNGLELGAASLDAEVLVEDLRHFRQYCQFLKFPRP